jgi:hypothetical protein
VNRKSFVRAGIAIALLSADPVSAAPGPAGGFLAAEMNMQSWPPESIGR